ncbi:MAG TPA: tape measure protein, partial [Ktedonobacteraceae bacterium]|nr:tape measure protein [Ktedonobacteraceae bacterium]
MKTMVLGAGSAMDSAFNKSASSLQSFSSSIKLAGGEATKLSSLQAKAAESAKRLEVAQAAAALALKRAMDMEQGGKASAEQLAVAQTKAALAAQQVQTRQDQLANATQKVASEEKSLANAMAQDARETKSFADVLNTIKGVLGSVGTGIKNATSGIASFASTLGGAAKGALSSVTSGIKGAITGLMEFGSKALSSGGQIFSGMEKATSSVLHFKSESSNMHVSFMSGIKSMIGGLIDFTGKIGLAIQGVRSMIDSAVGLGEALLNPAADAEQTSAAFTGLLGSAQKATVFLKDLRKFAASTPFEFPELAQDAREMLGFGFATKDVIPMMTRLGDAISTMGGSSADIDRAVLAIGQMHAKTKVTADEMNQLTELGIPAWDLLAKSMGKTTAQVMDLSSKGLIPADKGIEALLKGMERFKGGMDAQSKTFKGMLSNLKDGVTMALMAFGGPILDSAKTGLGDLINLVSSDAFNKFATVTGKGIASIIDRIGTSAAKVKGEFEAFSKTIDKISANNFAKGINYLAGQFGYLFGVLGGIGKIIFANLKDDFLKNADLAVMVSGTINRLGNIFHGAGEEIHRFTTFLTGVNFSPFVDGVAKGAGSIAKFLKGIDPIPVQLFFSSIEYLGTQLKRTAGIVGGTVLYLFKQLASSFDFITGKTTAFHKSFDIVNGVMVKT